MDKVDGNSIPMEVRRKLCHECGEANRCPHICSGDCGLLVRMYQKYAEQVEADASEEGGSDVVNEPEHYQHGTYEVIDEMVLVFGVDATVTFCRLNAWKYRARAPYKGKFEEDMAKADRYLQMAHGLMELEEARKMGDVDVPLLKFGRGDHGTGK